MSSISRLPESTTQLLSSSLVITTPTTLVKELVDNSIDAKASSIEVLITADTVKKIEVRDNGVGIHPNDYDALGRHGHTSKLRSFEELKTQSVKTLGFRGEALASANSLAQITITTKIASEPIAAILHIISGRGGVSKQQPTSAPIGTTVSTTNLFGGMPVRQRAFIKESAKTIDRIREVLRAYAMAKPQLRFSFKVLQSLNQNWSYSPKSDACVKEAAIQLFGAGIASHCFEKIFEINEVRSKSDGSNDCNPLLSGNYVFEAFILKPNHDPSKAPKLQYLSVDGRPITGKRGTMKKLLNIYIEQINAPLTQSSSATVIRDCFIRLNIKCPPGSYDVNIEPSKNDVLFSDENIVLDGFKGLCKEVYEVFTCSNPVEHSSTSDNRDRLETQEPSLIEPQGQSRSQGVDRRSYPLQTRGYTLQPNSATQAQRNESIVNHQPRPINSQEKLPQASSPINIGFTPINTRVFNTQNDPISTSTGTPNFKDISPNTGYARCRTDMSTDFNEYSQNYPRKKRSQPAHTLNDGADVVEFPTSQDVNPWVIAKMSAPTGGRECTIKDSTYENNFSLPVFEPSMTPDPPILRHTRAAPRDLDVPPGQQYLHSQDNPCKLLSRVPGGPYRSPMSSPHEMASHKTTNNAKMPAPLIPRRHRAYAPWSPPSSGGRTVLSSDLEINDEQELPSNGKKQTKISFKGAGGKFKKRRLEENSDDMDVVDAQDREYHNEDGLSKMLAAANRSLNHQLSQAQVNHNYDLRSYQTHVRQKANIQSQPFTQLGIDHTQEGGSSKIKEPIQTTLPNDDPRAYLLRRQKSMAAQEKSAIQKKPRRMKSSLLPLENVLSHDQIHFIVLIQVLNVKTLRTSTKGSVIYDKYVERGAIKNGLEMNLDTGRQVEGRLKSLLQGHCSTANGEEAELEIGLCSLLKGKSNTVVARA
ncbi:hypothetical protein F4805DRAFT_31649 [Annulohypoxylon moriforme]|nr:hypothetical protein F4805DRAFT_31649 [Annulohypoxylon moriforme]